MSWSGLATESSGAGSLVPRGRGGSNLAARGFWRACGRRLPGGGGPEAGQSHPKPSQSQGKACCKRVAPVLLRRCERVARVTFPCTTLVRPLYHPYTSLVPIIPPQGGSTAPPLGCRGRLARDNRGGLRWQRISPSIYLLPGPNKDALTCPRVTELLTVQPGNIAHAPDRSRQ